MKTIVNGKDIKLFDKAGIGVEFTKVVNEYLQNGFVFNLAESTSGTQGEEMRVNLTNDGGNTVYIIYVDRCSISDENFRRQGLNLVVEKFVDAKNASTLWRGRGEIVSEKIFYCISEYYGKNPVFADNKEDFEAISKITRERHHAKYSNKDKFKTLPATANKIAFRILKKMKGYKSVPLKNIEYVVREIGKGYAVKLVGQTYPLTLRCK